MAKIVQQSWMVTLDAPRIEAAQRLAARCAEVDPGGLNRLINLYDDWDPRQYLSGLPGAVQFAILAPDFLQNMRSAGVRKTVVFGAGWLGHEVLKALGDMGCEVVLFLDNDPSRQGRKVWGVPCVSPRSIPEVSTKHCVIASLRSEAVMAQELHAAEGPAWTLHRVQGIAPQGIGLEQRLWSGLQGQAPALCAEVEEMLGRALQHAVDGGKAWVTALLLTHLHRMAIDQVSHLLSGQSAPKLSPFIYTLQ